MQVPRNFSIFVQYILDEWVPPRIRDSKIFMYLPMRLVLKDATPDFMIFKNWIFRSTDSQFSSLYERTVHVQELQGETDLNQRCLDEILANVKNKKVLDAGCGRGFLANELSANNKVTGCDIVITDGLKIKYPLVEFKAGSINNLPFKDNEFDIVIATHTLEHVKDVQGAVNEMKRVAKEAIIIVVPRQRAYKYTFSLHTQFFPYQWSLEAAFGYVKNKTTIKKLGDWFYMQNLK